MDDVVRPLREALAVLLFAAVTAVLARRALRSGSLMRRILMPVVAVAAVRMVVLAVYFTQRRSAPLSGFGDALGRLYVLSLPALTLAFAAGLIAHRLFTADALAKLTRTLSSRPDARELRAALADALRDPTLDVLFAVDHDAVGWRDENGRIVRAPRTGPGQAVTEVRRGGGALAAIVHDEGLSYDPELLRGVVSYVATALENRELLGELRSSLDELAESRARLVRAADDERRRIERDLHDGAQQRVVALQIKLELLAEQLDSDAPDVAGEIRGLEGEIETTLDEVRRFGRGLHPSLLADRGLGDALRAVARTAPIPTTVDAHLPRRYRREIESGIYFACVEALQNATKHAHGATSVRIEVSANGRLRFEITDDGSGFGDAGTGAGAGLTNLRDRIGALGGSVSVTSAPGCGTQVTGIVPLA